MTGWGTLSFPARCFALWPLAGADRAEDRIGDAVAHVAAMLASDQMRFPLELESNMEAAVNAWERGDSQEAAARLTAAGSIAAQLGYL